MRILFISPPYRQPSEPSLAIATLRPMLEAHGHEVAELHASLLFPAGGHREVPSELFHWNGRYAFAHLLSGLPADVYADRAMQSMLKEIDPHGVITQDRAAAWPMFGVTEDQVRRDLLAKIAGGAVCLDRALAWAKAAGPFELVGFSAMFTDQLPAAVVLARRIRDLWPEARIVFGGAAVLEEQSDGLLATFPEIDVSCHSEGEAVILPLVAALSGSGSLADVPGISWRDGSGVHHNPSPPLLRDLDTLPVPDYRGFVEQLAASEWSAGGVDVFFETSRGCWWGEKSLCTFCGLNGEGLKYRAKSAERAHDEIRALYHRYPQANVLRAIDNILDMRYVRTLLPRLRDLATDPVRPLNLFFEIKSNVKPEMVETMVAAGVQEVQPGIESFSDDMLRLMRKGCTALGQVQFLKWAQQARLTISYNVLVLNPGEQAAWYGDMLRLLPFITHLPPPLGTPSVHLDRFSPYFRSPDEFGIRNVRPNAYFRLVFGDAADPRLAYKLDFDHAMYEDPEHLAAARTLVAAVRGWQAGWRPGMVYFVDDGDRLIVVDSRDGTETRSVIAGPAARIFLALDQHRSRGGLGEAFPELAAEMLDALLLTWLHRRWICRVGDRYLAVLPRRGPARMTKPVLRPAPVRREPLRLELV